MENKDRVSCKTVKTGLELQLFHKFLRTAFSVIQKIEINRKIEKKKKNNIVASFYPFSVKIEPFCWH
jgi:predicted enzyme involved in methoxymalonyl-ACP biosynthesis